MQFSVKNEKSLMKMIANKFLINLSPKNMNVKHEH